MKKIFCSLGIVLLLVGLAIAAELPAPFEAIKNIAMSGELFDGNVYAKQLQSPETKGLIYICAAFKDGNVLIAMVDMDAGLVIRVRRSPAGKYFQEVVIATPMGPVLLERKEVSESDGVALAYEFFRQLVSKNLI